MYWFVYLKKKPRYFIKRIPKNTRGVECTDCELKAETKARKILHVSYRWVNVQSLRNMPDVHETGADRQNLKNNYRQADSRHCQQGPWGMRERIKHS